MVPGGYSFWGVNGASKHSLCRLPASTENWGPTVVQIGKDR